MKAAMTETANETVSDISAETVQAEPASEEHDEQEESKDEH